MFNDIVKKNVDLYDNHNSTHTAITVVTKAVSAVAVLGFVRYMNKRADRLGKN